MKRITKREVILRTPEKWKLQYPNLDTEPHPSFSLRQGWTKEEKSRRQIYDELVELDRETATDKDIEDIIGNASWTRMKCDECGKAVDTLIRIGEPPEYDSRTAYVCPDCLMKAIALIE